MSGKISTLEKLYRAIGEAAQVIGVPVSTLRYWDRVGALVPSKRESGRRFYTPGDIQRGLQIKELVDAGYTLDGAVKRLEREASIPGEVIQEIRELLEMIKRIRRGL